MKLEICSPFARTYFFVVMCAPSKRLVFLIKVITLGELLTRLVKYVCNDTKVVNVQEVNFKN